MNTSLNRVMRNLNREIKKIEGASLAGLLEGVAIIRSDMDKTSPLVPVDLGNLRASWTASPIRRGKNPVVLAGFTADYALRVHEMVGGHFKRPGAGAKFYEASIKRNKKEVLNAIQRRVKV